MSITPRKEGRYGEEKKTGPKLETPFIHRRQDRTCDLKLGGLPAKTKQINFLLWVITALRIYIILSQCPKHNRKSYKESGRCDESSREKTTEVNPGIVWVTVRWPRAAAEGGGRLPSPHPPTSLAPLEHPLCRAAQTDKPKIRVTETFRFWHLRKTFSLMTLKPS